MMDMDEQFGLRTIAYVEWYDAFGDNGPMLPQHFEAGKGLLCITVGLFIKKTEHCYVLAAMENINGAIRDYFSIPIVIVRKVSYVYFYNGKPINNQEYKIIKSRLRKREKFS